MRVVGIDNGWYEKEQRMMTDNGMCYKVLRATQN
jgi:hypothetical protein